nr:enoyl-CoA-hydratase DpgD [Amycolatopsis keratiniphila]
MTSRVLYEKRGRVAYVTLNRPEVLNALDLRAHAELTEVWDDFEADGDLRVAVLTGAGKRAFCVGQDLKELAERRRAGHDVRSTIGSLGRPGWPRFTERFDFVKPVVAKVRGHAIGGGFELALACDVVVAEVRASFALPEVRLGLIAGAGGAIRLPKQIPYRIAIGHLLTGRAMSAARAYELGLVNEVVSEPELDASVDAWADEIAAAAPLSVLATKEVVSKSHHLAVDEAFMTRYHWEERRMCSADAAEGAAAFAENRPPHWRGC